MRALVADRSSSFAPVVIGTPPNPTQVGPATSQPTTIAAIQVESVTNLG